MLRRVFFYLEANSVLINGNPTKGRVVFCHGAGAPMDSDFMDIMADKMEAIGLEVMRIEFPYMQKRRDDGKKRPPDRMPVLLKYLEGVVERCADDVPLYIAGKSMGGRVASMLLDTLPVQSCFVFGYPFHPPGKPDNLRIEHLLTLNKQLLIFQGTRDPMGSIDEVEGYNLPENIYLHWLEDGNHDLKPRKLSGFTHEAHLDRVIEQIKDQVS